MSAIIETCQLSEISVVCETLIDGYSWHVDNATAYTNIGELNPEFACHLLHDIYVARTCELTSVTLSRFDKDTLLYGGEEFLVASDGRLLRDQVAPYLGEEPDRLERLIGEWRPTIQVHEECMLAARYGIYTWGHWLAELLPRLVLAEARFPGRFRYVLPSLVLTEANPRSPIARIRESLLSYGIGMNRVLALHPAMNYRFDRLHAVSSVWSDHILHPAAAALMRTHLIQPGGAQPAPGRPRRVGLLRAGPDRAIANIDEANALLSAYGFALHKVGDMMFSDQVQLFQSASVIFAILGSDLTGLIYAPEGIRVISVAPAVFGDRFFYALMLDRKGRYADLRGPIVTLNPAAEHRSSFHIATSEIIAAMEALGSEA
jgi:hypothetical protein